MGRQKIVLKTGASSMAYDLKSVKAPRLAGLGLRIFANLIEWGFPGKLIIPQLLRDAGVTAFRRKASNSCCRANTSA